MSAYQEVSVHSSMERMRARAEAVLAGKQSNFRTGATAESLISSAGRGFRIIDSDGRDYIDFVLGMGPAIWGQSDPRYNQAIRNQIDLQLSAASALLHTEVEIAFAERVQECVPCAELVRFGISGSEAVQMAMRLCRGATGRRFIARCASNYHGWLDPAFGGEVSAAADGTIVPTPATGAGLAPHAYADMLMIRWGHVEDVERLLASRGNEIAAIFLEAALCNFHGIEPPSGYLQQVRDLCDKYDVPLVFDEVITGFRASLGGAQELYGVTPDLAIFGKALAGGLPLSAIAGSKKILSALKDNRVLGGGTFNSFPLAMSGGIATLDMLRDPEIAYFDKLAANQRLISDALVAAGHDFGFTLTTQGPPGLLAYNFTKLGKLNLPEDVSELDLALATQFRALLQEEGVLTAGGFRMMISGAMPQSDIEEAIARIREAFRKLSEATG